MTKQLAGTEAEFDAVLDIIIRHREKALNNVNVENLLTNWEIGAFISRRLEQAAWGSAAIDGLVDHIRRHDPMAKGYGRRNLYNMVAVYDSFSSNEFMELLRRCGQFVQPTAAQIGVGEIVQPVAAQMSGCAEVVQPVAGQTIPPVLFLTTFTNLVEIVNRVRSAQERRQERCRVRAFANDEPCNGRRIQAHAHSEGSLAADVRRISCIARNG